MPRLLCSLMVMVSAAAAQDAPVAPWRTDLKAAREEARKAGAPCVLILNSNARAL